MWQIFSRMRLKCHYFWKKCLSTFFWSFLAKIRKKLKLQKLENTISEYFEKKKRFHPSKRHFQQCWRAQNNPEVAGCLALYELWFGTDKIGDFDYYHSAILSHSRKRWFCLVRKISGFVSLSQSVVLSHRKSGNFVSHPWKHISTWHHNQWFQYQIPERKATCSLFTFVYIAQLCLTLLLFECCLDDLMLIFVYCYSKFFVAIEPLS